jgi:hypothetical protein
MEDPSSLLAWIERLGGWGAFLLAVRWFVLRLDRSIQQTEKTLSSYLTALEHFKRFEEKEEEVHSAIIETQREILEAIKDLKSEDS